MKKAFIISTILLLSVFVYWQTSKKETNPSFASIQLGEQNHSFTFDEMRKDEIRAKMQRKANGVVKKDKPGEFVKFYNSIRVKPGDDALKYGPNYKLEELNKARQKVMMKSETMLLDWKERGPGNVSGRTRALIIDPDDPTCDTWFAGSVSGGIWKTTDAGESWTDLTPDLPNLAISSLAMAASNTQVIYAGTGEGFFNIDAVHGDGIFKSTDKGLTWLQLTSTMSSDDFGDINRIVVDPLDEKSLIAVTNKSVQKSIDGGQSWRQVFSDNGYRIQQVIIAVNSLDTLYATVNSKGVIKSIDRGENWEYVLDCSNGRIEMAISPTDPSIVYALDEKSNLYMSEDYGASWAGSVIVSGSSDVFLGDQGWYNNTIAVMPDDPSQVLIGGINLYGVTLVGDSIDVRNNVDTIGTASFMRFVSHGNENFGGAAYVNDANYNKAQIEIQFGAGKKQFAHRFTVPVGATSGVSADAYTYQDYVEVPFEVWDVDHNEQLMISFRDQSRNGAFDLTLQNDDLLQGREYLWINDVSYAEQPNSNIAVSGGGHEYNYVFYTWPVLSDGAVWNAQALPNSKIIISSKEWALKKLESDKITYAYSQEDGQAYVHPDMHNILFGQKTEDTTRIIVCHDGGIAYSDDEGIIFVNPEKGYNTTQFYGVDKKANEDRYVGGAQDNGSWVSLEDPSPLSNWIEATGGDGFDAVWHPFTGEVITSSQTNMLYRIGADGQSVSYLDGFVDVADNAPFLTQIGYNPSAPNNLFIVGASGVSYSKDFGDTWNLSVMEDSLWRWNYWGFVEPSLVSPDIVWAVSHMDQYGNMMLSKDGGQSFDAAGNTDSILNRVSGLATHPSNEKSAFALFSYPKQAKILRTTNFGNTWEDISGFENGESQHGFPDVAVHCLLVMPYDTATIWVGTEIGLFISEDNGVSWAYSNNGLPAVSIWEMKIRDQQVILATHGRGIWTVDMFDIQERTALPFFMDVNTTPSSRLLLDYVQPVEYDSLALCVDSTLYFKLPISSSISETQEQQVNVALDSGMHVLQLIAYYDDEVLKSTILPYLYIPYNLAQESYSNSFDQEDNDFIYNGIAIEDYGDLETTMALHTQHPYPENQELYAALRTPIVLKSDDQGHSTQLSYSDIPMVEEGEIDSQFGTVDFYDYVSVMGSKDGKNWIPLSAGYDFRAVKDQASGLGLTVDSEPSSLLFTDRMIDLLTYFEANDTILIVFYLYSDTYTAGWGWVIDNIDIKFDLSTSDNKLIFSDFDIYPMPCSEQLNVRLGEPLVSRKELFIYDMNGKMVKHEMTTNDQYFSINTMALQPASYILEIKSGSEVFRKKFMVLR